MSFQESSHSIRARLHMGTTRPAVVIGLLAVLIIAITCAVFSLQKVAVEDGFAVVASGSVAEEHAADSDAAEGEPSVSMVRVHVTGCVANPGVYDVEEGSRVGDAVEQAGGFADDANSEVVNLARVVNDGETGCVANPGVYDVEEGSRVGDAVEQAGGFADDANSEVVNLARVVNDGEQIVIPSAEDESAQGEGAGFTGSSSGQIARVNINTADIATLMTLDGVGEATAKKIVAEREGNGPFATVDDLTRVPGIGEKKLEALRDRVTVG